MKVGYVMKKTTQKGRLAMLLVVSMLLALALVPLGALADDDEGDIPVVDVDPTPTPDGGLLLFGDGELEGEFDDDEYVDPVNPGDVGGGASVFSTATPVSDFATLKTLFENALADPAVSALDIELQNSIVFTETVPLGWQTPLTVNFTVAPAAGTVYFTVAGEGYRHFQGEGSIVTFNFPTNQSIIIDGGYTSDMGAVSRGGISVERYYTGNAYLELNNAVVQSCSRFTPTAMYMACVDGAGVEARGTGIINNCKIINNTLGAPSGHTGYAEYCGGGLFIREEAVVTNSTISGNRIDLTHMESTSHSIATGAGFSDENSDYGTPYNTTVTNCTIEDNFFIMKPAAHSNKLGLWGAGIYSQARLCTIENSSISNNGTINLEYGAGGAFGGGICKVGFKIVIKNSKIDGNTSTYGGGVHIDESTDADITNSSVSRNTAAFGGGLNTYDGPSIINVSGSTFEGNTASQQGGGFYICIGNTLNVKSTAPLGTTASKIIKNIAEISGGGIYAESGSTINVTNSDIGGNSAVRGGGIALCEAALSVGNSKIYKNTAETHGGGVYDSGSATVNLSNTSIYDNECTDLLVGTGGGVYSGLASTVSIYTCEVYGNKAAYGGGASYEDVTLGTVSVSNFHDNLAYVHGGGLHLSRFAKGYTTATGSYTITRNTFADNAAPNGDGGAIWHDYVGHEAAGSTRYGITFAFNKFSGNTASFATQLIEAKYVTYHDAVFDGGYSTISLPASFTSAVMNNYDINYRDADAVKYYALTTECIPPEGGSVTVTVNGVPWNGTDLIPEGAAIVITATVNSGYSFTGWGLTAGVASTTNGRAMSFTMPGKNVHAIASFTTSTTPPPTTPPTAPPTEPPVTEIPENTPPLGEHPDPVEPEEELEIDPEEPPLAVFPPKTSDSGAPAVFAVLFVLSALATVVLLARRIEIVTF